MALFAARSVINFDDLCEERMVLFTASASDDASQKAVTETLEYVDALSSGLDYGLQQIYQLDGTEISDGTEVFSLMRMGELGADDYLSRHFDTGTERQGHL
ncbi:MAG TPA: hypothetical protein VJR25_12955 [Microbacterium sp.]|uniref:hypothetical protein n=1 Tax=Microbacterium sp. TaxID=51671 RepID=UPI002B4A7538|nr:hypothetical protein [Microbacterium sp.]HKT57673.1 hypothetical protein [Microbacterium sp.]